MSPPERGSFLPSLLKAWFGLSPEEQKTLAMVLLLFLLGIVARFWYVFSSQ